MVNGVSNGTTLVPKRGARKFIATPQTGNYRASVMNAWFNPAIRDGRMTWRDIPAMLLDPYIQIGLRVLCSRFGQLQWTIKCNNKDAGAFIHKTLERFVQNDMQSVLRSLYVWGTVPAEVEYDIVPNHLPDAGQPEYKSIRQFRWPDTLPWALRGKVTHFFVNNVNATPGKDAQPQAQVNSPFVFWVANDPEPGQVMGKSRFEAAWMPWMERNGVGGAKASRKLWAYKYAFNGGMIRYPSDGTVEIDGTIKSNQDYAQEMLEKMENGAVVALPSDRDDKGELLWEYVPATANVGSPEIMALPEELGKEIWLGMGIMPEVIQASETGSGWSGRSVPFLSFLNDGDGDVKLILSEFKRRVLEPLVEQRFGDVPFEIVPTSLVPKDPDGGSSAAPQTTGNPQAAIGAEQQNDQQAGQQMPVQMSLHDAISDAAAVAHVSPTESQKQAGNYRKGHVVIQGLDITIECAKGNKRRDDWQPLEHHYGYIKRTESRDGEHLDCFIGPNPESEIVFVIDQAKASGRFDEHKVLLGFTNERDAKDGYLANYPSGWIIGNMKALPMNAFKEWIENGDTSKPICKQAISLSQSSETGHWITIGGKKSGDGKRHGGSPVYIEGGRITKGAPSLHGKKIASLDQPAEHGSHRQQLNQSKSYSRAVHAKQARKQGVPSSHLHQLAGEILAHHNAFNDDVRGLLQDTRRTAKKLGIGVHHKSGAFEGGDHTEIKGFDLLARQMAGRYPHLLGAHGSDDNYGYDANAEEASEKLFALLQAGNPEPMSEDDAYEQAKEFLIARRQAETGQNGQRPRRQVRKAAHDDPIPFSQNSTWDESKHPRDDHGHWAEAIAGIGEGELKHVGGLPVRRHDEKYRIETSDGHIAGDASAVADHIVNDHVNRRLEGKSRHDALNRAADYIEPDALMDSTRFYSDAKAFNKLPHGTRVVSLHPDTHGRMGTVHKSDDGANAVILDGDASHGSPHVEPINPGLSWRAKAKVAASRPLGTLFDEPAPKTAKRSNAKKPARKEYVDPNSTLEADTEAFFRAPPQQGRLFMSQSAAPVWMMTQAEYLAEPVSLSQDASGHNHKGKGIGGGQFTSGDAASLAAEPSSTVVKATKSAAEVYHYLHDKGAEGFHKLPTPVQKAVSTTLAVAFAGWTASQKVAERISIEKGSTPEEAAALRSVLAAWDVVAFKPMAIATAPLGGAVAAASWIIPPITGVYLAHATVMHPMATYRAAKGLVKDAISSVKKSVADHTDML